MAKTGITWSQKLVEVRKIKPTPTNYKIKSDLGLQRFRESFKKFGLASSVVCNADLTLIDGNTRVAEAKEKKMTKIWVSVPNRKLTPKEFKEMAAMFDYAVAGEVDMERVEKDLGTSAEFFKRWGLQVPMEMLDNLGAKAKVDLSYPEEGKKKAKKGATEPGVGNIKMVNLFFSVEQEAAFREWEEKAAKKFKTKNTTETVWRALKSVKV